MKTGVVVDSHSYSKQNCFVHQLVHELNSQRPNEFPKLINWRFIKSFLSENLGKKFFQNYDHLVILLRQRVLASDMELLSRLVRDLPITIYDQDPWNVYWDQFHTQGHYQRLGKLFNLRKLAVPSQFWKNFIESEEGFCVAFVRMGMLPRYCTTGNSFAERLESISFRGTLYEHRKHYFENLSKMGINVSIRSNSLDYRQYLNYLDNVKIFIHDESDPLTCNGVRIPRSTGMWHKDIEAASRGCFVIRDYHEESVAYEISSIPTIYTYRRASEIPNILKSINAMRLDEIEAARVLAVENIRLRDDWKKTANTLLQI